MHKFTARLVAGMLLAMGAIVPTAIVANANPPRTNNCYSTYRDGVVNPSYYTYLNQTVSQCIYRKYTTYYYCACTKAIGIIYVNKKSAYV